MQKQAEQRLKGRQKGRLSRARDSGFLEVRGPDSEKAFRFHGAWCWRLRLPLVWFERNSPSSRYGHVHLDLFTSGKWLTDRGLEELRALAPAEISPYDAAWKRVPRRDLPALAARVIRVAVRPENLETTAVRRIEVLHRGPARIIEMSSPQAASA
jgi:hypothetical protein